MALDEVVEMAKHSGVKGRIAWSMSGEGAGHAARNLVLMQEMSRRGYDIDVYTYADTYASLRDYFSSHSHNGIRLRRIPGIVFHYDKKGMIHLGKVIVRNFEPVVRSIESFNKYVRMVRKSDYCLFVMDFEPFFSRAVKRARPRAPQVQVSALQAGLAYGKVDRPRNMTRTQFSIFRGLVRQFQPRPDKVIITAFVKPRSLDRIAVFAGPIVREEIRTAKTSDKGFILVYAKPIIEELVVPAVLQAAPALKKKFIVYVKDPEKYTRLKSPGASSVSSSVSFKRIALGGGFLQDFVSCSGVIGTGGTELAGEALCLKKPLLAVMQTHQYEQYVSGHYISKIGLGHSVLSVDFGKADIEKFVRGLGSYRSKIAAYRKGICWGNDVVPDMLEACIADAKHGRPWLPTATITPNQ